MRNRMPLILALAALAVAVAVLLAIKLASSGRETQAALFAPSVLGAQPPGAVVLAREDKDLAVALALKPQASGLLAIATVLSPAGTGATGLTARFTVTTSTGTTVNAPGEAGALGTYQALLATTGRPVTAIVTLAGPGSSGKPVRFPLPVAWPPRSAAALMTKVDRVYSRLKTLVTHERLASDPIHVVNTVYRAIAPSTLAIESSNDTRAVVIGAKRWDKQPGAGWRESVQSPPVNALAPFWAGIIQDPTLLGSTTVGGRHVWFVSFAAPQIPAFFQLDVDKATSRTLDLRMTASAHFMHHRYGPFDSPLTITPPK